MVKKHIEDAAILLWVAGDWEGRKSAVILGKRFGVASTSMVLRIAENAIKQSDFAERP